MKINSYDGTEIHYTSEGSGPALVCSYGIICGSYHFKYQTSYFKNHYQVIHYDYRGHNKSQLPKNLEDLTIKGSAYDLKAVLDDLGIEKAILMGHSMGAAVNMEFYRLFPDRVKAMIILCGSVTNPLEIMFYTDITKALFELLKLGFLKYPETLNSLWQNLPAGIGQTFVSLLGHNILLAQKEDIKLYLEGAKQHPLKILLYFLQDYSEFKGFPICEKIACPTLIVAGQYDHLTPKSYMEKLHQLIKTSELFIVPQGSHVSQWDMPEVVNLRIEKFLSNI